MKWQRLKPIAAGLIIVATIAIFIWYIKANPAVVTQLRATDPWLIFGLLALYGLFMGSLVLIQLATLQLSRLTIPRRDNILLTIYSTIINFFGPLQSGPGFRAAYLKKKFGVSLKRYTAATLGYYVCFAGWSALFIATALSWHWWLAGIMIALIGGVLTWRFAAARITAMTQGWQWRSMVLMALATLAQLSIVAVIYWLELKSLDSEISFHQALIYAGAANFALFVSVTPGAIGFRESFVLFAQQLHHIPTDTVVAASLLDRATYIILLGILFIVTLAFHAKAQLTGATRSDHQVES